MENKQDQYLIPGAIILAGIIIAVAVIFSGSGGSANADGFGNSKSASAEEIRDVNKDDHIFGNKKAKVSIIEFSDFECPFCARYHPTLSRIVEEFGDDVNWAYRHFPLTQIHSLAQSAAVASECVANLAGNDAFWGFTDELFKKQSQLGNELLNELALSFGISQEAFSSCMADEDILSLVEDDYNEAIAGGGTGTPFTVIVSKKGKFPFSGALPYAQVKKIIEQAL